jgi:hypothetical protein
LSSNDEKLSGSAHAGADVGFFAIMIQKNCSDSLKRYVSTAKLLNISNLNRSTLLIWLILAFR